MKPLFKIINQYARFGLIKIAINKYMTDKKLTPNFKLSEFINIDPTEYQLSLIQLLAENLQKVRDKLQDYAIVKKKVSIVINSGVRTQEDYDRLKKTGYNPSKTSDHFCGLQLLCSPTLGAVDISVKNCKLTIKEIAALLIQWDKENSINFGQIIYEYNPKTKGEWIHLGNDWEEIFTDKIKFKRKKYLMSLDNGKTYKIFK